MASSRRMTSGRDLGRNPRTGVPILSMLKTGLAVLNMILLGHGTMAHSRSGFVGRRPRPENVARLRRSASAIWDSVQDGSRKPKPRALVEVSPAISQRIVSQRPKVADFGAVEPPLKSGGPPPLPDPFGLRRHRRRRLVLAQSGVAGSF